MKKSFLIPLVAAVVAAGGAFATGNNNRQAMAYGFDSSNECVEAPLIEAQSCSNQPTLEQCEVEIEGLEKPAFSNATCTNEIFRQPEN